MIKFIKYHLLYLFNDLWLLLAIIITLVSGFLFFYLGNGFDSSIQRLLESKSYLKEFENEAFLVCNLILSIWVINASKEIFIVTDPHIMVINKRKYIKSKTVAYLLYYFFITLLVYGAYQINVFFLYGTVKYNYFFIVNLLFNVCLIHLLVIILSGKNRNILISIIFLIIYLIFNTLMQIDFYLKSSLEFFLPLLYLNKPIYGYLHNFLIILLLFNVANYKHISYYE